MADRREKSRKPLSRWLSWFLEHVSLVLSRLVLSRLVLCCVDTLALLLLLLTDPDDDDNRKNVRMALLWALLPLLLVLCLDAVVLIAKCWHFDRICAIFLAAPDITST